MKKLKTLISVVLSAMLVLSLVVPSMADEKGKITIEGAFEGKTYTIYRILDVVNYSNEEDAEKATYKPASDLWKGFLQSMSAYVTIDDQQYVTWNDGANIKNFVKEAIKFAKENKTAEGLNNISITADEKKTVVFENLKLGYYLLDTTAGSICSIDSTTTDVVIKEKNTLPSITKEVQEDSTEDYGESNTADIGQTVNFRATITAFYGAEKYVMHDVMHEALSFNTESVVIKVDNNKTLTAGADKDYVLKTDDLDDNCTFEIEFTQTFLDGIGSDIGDSAEITVDYTADILTTAVAHDELTNTVTLQYGDNHTTESDTTKTFIFDFKLQKTDGKDQISGAEFELYLGNDKINLVEENGGYRIATPAEVAKDGFVSKKIAVGKATITGLDAGTYTLREVKVPDGYNSLAQDPVFSITEEGKVVFGGKVAVDDTVIVVNTAGSLLPTTGGMGTKVLFTVGGIMMVVAFVLFTSKRRMAAED